MGSWQFRDQGLRSVTFSQDQQLFTHFLTYQYSIFLKFRSGLATFPAKSFRDPMYIGKNCCNDDFWISQTYGCGSLKHLR